MKVKKKILNCFIALTQFWFNLESNRTLFLFQNHYSCYRVSHISLSLLRYDIHEFSRTDLWLRFIIEIQMGHHKAWWFRLKRNEESPRKHGSEEMFYRLKSVRRRRNDNQVIFYVEGCPASAQSWSDGGTYWFVINLPCTLYIFQS